MRIPDEVFFRGSQVIHSVFIKDQPAWIFNGKLLYRAFSEIGNSLLICKTSILLISSKELPHLCWVYAKLLPYNTSYTQRCNHLQDGSFYIWINSKEINIQVIYILYQHNYNVWHIYFFVKKNLFVEFYKSLSYAQQFSFIWKYKNN